MYGIFAPITVAVSIQWSIVVASRVYYEHLIQSEVRSIVQVSPHDSGQAEYRSLMTRYMHVFDVSLWNRRAELDATNANC